MILPPSDVATPLLNDEWWLTRRDDRLELIRADDMGYTHRLRLLGWLRRHSVQLHAQAKREIERRHRHDEITDAERIRLLLPLAAGPEVWLEDTALVRRLVAITPKPVPAPRRRRWLPERLRGGR